MLWQFLEFDACSVASLLSLGNARSLPLLYVATEDCRDGS